MAQISFHFSQKSVKDIFYTQSIIKIVYNILKGHCLVLNLLEDITISA